MVLNHILSGMILPVPPISKNQKNPSNWGRLWGFSDLSSGKGRSEKGDWPPVNGAKTVAEVEAEMAKSKIERVKRNLKFEEGMEDEESTTAMTGGFQCYFLSCSPWLWG